MTTTAAAAIDARQVHKRFGGVHAVNGIDLVVPAGACFGLIGENGAGKTTFIKMLLGIARPDEGALTVLGASPDDARARRRVGYLPERLTLPPPLSPVGFLRSVGRLKGLSSNQLAEDVPRVLNLVGLEEVAWKRKTGGFSKGMKQRTGLAAALLGDPQLLVLDEPTDGIDPLGRKQLRDVIKSVVDRGTTVFLNSHLLAETERICDRIAVLARGRVVLSGALKDLKREDSFRVVVKRGEGVAAAGAALGFVEIDAGGAADVTFRYTGVDAAAMSSALAQLIGRGAVIVEVAPELKDLETVLAEAVAQSGGSVHGGANTKPNAAHGEVQS